MVGIGVPVVVTVKLPATPTVKVVVAALVIVGARWGAALAAAGRSAASIIKATSAAPSRLARHVATDEMGTPASYAGHSGRPSQSQARTICAANYGARADTVTVAEPASELRIDLRRTLGLQSAAPARAAS